MTEPKTIIEYKSDNPHLIHEYRHPLSYDVKYPSNKPHVGAVRKYIEKMIDAEARYAGNWLVLKLCDPARPHEGSLPKLKGYVKGHKDTLVKLYIESGMAPGEATANELVKRVETSALKWAAAHDDKAAELLKEQRRRGPLSVPRQKPFRF